MAKQNYIVDGETGAMDEKEVSRMIKAATQEHEIKLRGFGCGTTVGCFRGKEIQTFLDNNLEPKLKELKEKTILLEKKTGEAIKMMHDLLGMLQDYTKTSKELSKLPWKIVIYVIGASTISSGATIILIKTLGVVV